MIRRALFIAVLMTAIFWVGRPLGVLAGGGYPADPHAHHGWLWVRTWCGTFNGKPYEFLRFAANSKHDRASEISIYPDYPRTGWYDILPVANDPHSSVTLIQYAVNARRNIVVKWTDSERGGWNGGIVARKLKPLNCDGHTP